MTAKSTVDWDRVFCDTDGGEYIANVLDLSRSQCVALSMEEINVLLAMHAAKLAAAVPPPPSYRAKLDAKFPPMFEAVKFGRIDLVQGLLNWGAPVTGPLPPAEATEWRDRLKLREPPCSSQDTTGVRMSITDVASRYDHISLLQWSKTNDPPIQSDPTRAMIIAAAAGSLACLQYWTTYIDHRAQPNAVAMALFKAMCCYQDACTSFLLNFLMLLKSSGILRDSVFQSVVQFAAQQKRLDVLEQIEPLPSDATLRTCWLTFIECEFEDGIQWCLSRQKNNAWPNYAPVFAVQCNRLALLRRMHVDMNGLTRSNLGFDERKRLESIAAQGGHVEILQFLCDEVGDDLFDKCLYWAAVYGRCKVVEFILDRFPKFTLSAEMVMKACFADAAHRGSADDQAERLALIHMLRSRRYIIHNWDWRAAIPYSDHVLFCRYLLQSPGYMDRMRSFLDDGGVWSPSVLFAAVQHGYVDLVEFALRHGCQRHDRLFSHAMRFGHLQICELLQKYHVEWKHSLYVDTEGVIYVPVEMKDNVREQDVLACLQYAVRLCAEQCNPSSTRDPWVWIQSWMHLCIELRWTQCLTECMQMVPDAKRAESACSFAIRHGSLEYVKRCHAIGIGCKLFVPNQYNACTTAAKHGYLDLLHYAYGNLDETPDMWNATVLKTAVDHNQLDCLVYAHQHQCPYSVQDWHDMCRMARERMHLDVLQYLDRHMRLHE